MACGIVVEDCMAAGTLNVIISLIFCSPVYKLSIYNVETVMLQKIMGFSFVLPQARIIFVAV